MANPNGTPRNLRAFPRGRSGNPGGRPRGLSITATLRAELDRPCADDPSVTKAERIAERLVGLALAGDLAAIREVLNRTEGKAVARQETGEPGAFDDLADVPTTELRRYLAESTAPDGPTGPA